MIAMQISEITLLKNKIAELEAHEADLLNQNLSLQETSETRQQLFHICHMAANMPDLMRELTSFLQIKTGCHAVGVRLRQGYDYPYFETRGFSESFVRAENSLCKHEPEESLPDNGENNPVLECMCGNILQRRFNPDLPFFTQHGSFWTNSTSELLATTSESDRQARTRNRCNGEGYESVALIPLHLHDKTFGLLQLNDKRKGCFSPEKIQLLEELVSYITIALAKHLTDEELRASRKTLNAILNAAPEPIFLMDVKGTVLAGNAALAERLQAPLEKILGSDVYRCLTPDLAAARRRHIDKAVFTGLPLHFQDERLGRTFEHYVYPVNGENGQVTQLAIFATDITERATAEQALQRSQALLNATQQLTHVGGWEWDVASQTMTWTDETYRIHGLAPKLPAVESDDLIEKSLQCYNPTDRSIIMEAFHRCLNQGDCYDLEFPFTTVQGQRRWIRTIGAAIRRSGQIVGVRGNILDITESHKKTELPKARLRLSEAATRLDLQALVRMILDETEAITGSRISFLHFYDAEQQTISLQAWSTATARSFCAIEGFSSHYPLQAAGVWADSIREGRPVIHNDYTKLAGRKGMPPGHIPVVREMVVPIIRNNRIVAILGIGNKQSDYDPEDIDLVSNLANLAWDIILQKQAEIALRESEKKYRGLFTLLRSMCDNVSDMIWAKDQENRYIFVNKAMCRTLLQASDTDEPLGKTELFFAQRERNKYPNNPGWHTFGELCQDSDRITLKENSPQQFDEYGNVQGKFLYLDVRKAPFIDENGITIGTVGSARDISKRKMAEEALQNSLAEKEVLLREVHHRVKNNLAAIIGLFDLQRQTMADSGARTILRELSSRVRAMSLVHEKLYRSESLSKIDFQDYTQSLISHLRTSFGSPSIHCEIATHEIAMPLDLAVPCGMIINELITNALKYAFPPGMTNADKTSCRILIALTHENDIFSLTVADNGVGLPTDFDWTSAKTLGLMLVRMLGQHQLGGQYELDRTGGTRFTLTFSLRNGRDTHA